MTIKYIKSDLYRYAGNCSCKSFLINYLSQRGFNFTFWLRLASSKGIISKFAYPIYFYKKRRYGLDVSHKTKIGYGLYIGHGGPLIVNPTATIGNNVNLSQYVTIGSNLGKAAEIADYVYIGPNVCIVEDVKIGRGASIGAGSIVVKNIPENATAAGNYARTLNYNTPGRFIQNPWPMC